MRLQFLPSFKRPPMALIADVDEASTEPAVAEPPYASGAQILPSQSWFDSSFDLQCGLEVREVLLTRFDLADPAEARWH